MRAISISIIGLCLITITTLTGPVSARRVVSCKGVDKVIPRGIIGQLYQIGGLVNETYNFDTLGGVSAVRHGGVDFAEYLNTLHSVAPIMNSDKIPLPEQAAAWNQTWAKLGDTMMEFGEAMAAEDDAESAMSYFHRASAYYQLADRFAFLESPVSLHVFNKSIAAFKKALSFEDPNGPRCHPAQVPFGGEGKHLHGYFCEARPRYGNLPGQAAPTVIYMGGFDSSAEMSYYESRFMVKRGFNVFVFDGPGQGATVRFQKIHFEYNTELATSTVLDYAIANFPTQLGVVNGSVLTKPLIVAGISMGGYLASRAFAYEPRFDALIANGGVYDFYQSLVCKLDKKIRDLYFLDDPSVDAKLNSIIDNLDNVTSSLHFFLQYGRLGSGKRKYTDIVEYFTNFTLEGHMHRFDGRSVWVNDPAWDTLTGNQSQIFWAHGSPFMSNKSEIVQLDPYRGGGLHCSVGSTSNLQLSIGSWLRKVTMRK